MLARSVPLRSALLSCALAGLGLMAPDSAFAQQLQIGSQCSLPGPIADDRCTVLYHVNNNPVNNIVCLWNENALVACEGRARWGAGYEYVPSTGTTLEFRRHATWPTSHPSWPGNPSAVRNSGTLLKQQAVQARYRASPNGACNVTVPAGGNIQAALDQPGVTTVCLGAGDHYVLSTLMPKNGQTLRGDPNGKLPSVLRPAAGAPADLRVISLYFVNGVTVKGLKIDSRDTQRAEFGILAYGATDALIEGVTVSRSKIGIGVNNASSNIEIRNSLVEFAGDGLAHPGGAQASIWISDSSDVRVMKSVVQNNGVGPEGDGELGCYNSPDVAIHGSQFLNIGASAIYLVNCDRAVVSGNLVSRAKEWGLDVVNTGQPSGTDYALFSWNTVEYTTHAAVILKDSIQNTFHNNTYRFNRQGPGASGSCNGVNLRGTTTGTHQFNDTVSSGSVWCRD